MVLDILDAHAEPLSTLAAAKRNHHAFVGGFLEHVLNVTRTACFLADQYAKLYDQMQPPLDTDVVVAAAVLHDIGKLRELADTPGGAEYTAAGSLIGHVLQGRDIVRETAVRPGNRRREAAAAGARDHRPPAAARVGPPPSRR